MSVAEEELGGGVWGCQGVQSNSNGRYERQEVVAGVRGHAAPTNK